MMGPPQGGLFASSAYILTVKKCKHYVTPAAVDADPSRGPFVVPTKVGFHAFYVNTEAWMARPRPP
jgi:hypothetical protein